MSKEILDALTEIVGRKGILLGEEVSARPNFSLNEGTCEALAILRPASTDELSRVLKVCHAHKQAVVPLGGLSGLVNGITCKPGDIGLSTERMKEIEGLDADAGVITVQAGAVLQTVQEYTEKQGWLFALDLGARGSATIGGAISTNAGGNSVVRYGMMRQQVLGLEVVMADGTIITSMNEMLKNNAAYDLKQLFIGSEGTLGIVSRAVLRLVPLPSAVQTAFVAVNDFPALTTLLKHLGVALEGKLSAFEVMWQNHYTLLVDELAKHQAFLPSRFPYYILIESSGADKASGEDYFTSVLAELMEKDIIADAVISQSGQQTKQIWAMRDDIDSLVNTMFPAIIFDISLPLRHMEEYVEAVNCALAKACPETRIVTFGHLGDGNIHFATGPVRDKEAVERSIYEPLERFSGCISAEHGIGLDKKPYLHISRSDEEIALMRTLKKALDPKNILNPGKIF